VRTRGLDEQQEGARDQRQGAEQPHTFDVVHWDRRGKCKNTASSGL
jgi:hypothetical protein